MADPHVLDAVDALREAIITHLGRFRNDELLALRAQHSDGSALAQAMVDYYGHPGLGRAVRALTPAGRSALGAALEPVLAFAITVPSVDHVRITLDDAADSALAAAGSGPSPAEAVAAAAQPVSPAAVATSTDPVAVPTAVPAVPVVSSAPLAAPAVGSSSPISDVLPERPGFVVSPEIASSRLLAFHGVSHLIVGGPGAGKTAHLVDLRDRLVALGRRVAVVGPTGAAAQNARRDGKTIHSAFRLGIRNDADPDYHSIDSKRRIGGNPVGFDSHSVDVPLPRRAADLSVDAWLPDGPVPNDPDELMGLIHVLMVDECGLMPALFADRTFQNMRDRRARLTMDGVPCSDLPFGGVTVIGFADPRQAQPVESQSRKNPNEASITAALSSRYPDGIFLAALHLRDLTGEAARAGREAYAAETAAHQASGRPGYPTIQPIGTDTHPVTFPVVRLHSGHRYPDEPGRIDFLRRVATNTLTADDVQRLRSLHRPEWSTPESVPLGELAGITSIIVGRNVDVHRANQRRVFARASSLGEDRPREVCHFMGDYQGVKDYVKGSAVPVADRAGAVAALSRRAGRTTPDLGMYIGMPVIFRHNKLEGATEDYAHDRGFANGTRGELVAFGFPKSRVPRGEAHAFESLAGPEAGADWPLTEAAPAEALVMPKAAFVGPDRSDMVCPGFYLAAGDGLPAGVEAADPRWLREMRAVVRVPLPLDEGHRYIVCQAKTKGSWHGSSYTGWDFLSAFASTDYIIQGRSFADGDRLLVFIDDLLARPGSLLTALSRTRRTSETEWAGADPGWHDLPVVPGGEFIEEYFEAGVRFGRTIVEMLERDPLVAALGREQRDLSRFPIPSPGLCGLQLGSTQKA